MVKWVSVTAFVAAGVIATPVRRITCAQGAVKPGFRDRYIAMLVLPRGRLHEGAKGVKGDTLVWLTPLPWRRRIRPCAQRLEDT
jgi:hypothetical protein